MSVLLRFAHVSCTPGWQPKTKKTTGGDVLHQDNGAAVAGGATRIDPFSVVMIDGSQNRQ